MTIDLFIYNGPRKKVNKTITVIQRDIPIHLLDDTDVVNPIIEIETSGVGTMSQIISANYAKIPEFENRTYFIVKKDVTNNNIIRLYLHSDPLTSFKDDVVTWSGVVEVVDDNGRNSYLSDQLTSDGVKGIVSNSNYTTSVNGTTSCRTLGSTVFNKSAFYLVTTGANPVSGVIPNYVTPMNSGFFNIYTHNSDARGIQEVAFDLWSMDPTQIVTTALLKPVESIISLHILPFQINNLVATHTVNAGYEHFELDNTVLGVGNPYQHFDLGTMTIISPSNTSDFKYFAPYREYKMFLPFLGFIDINPNNFLNLDGSGNNTYCECNICYDINVMTGDFTVTLRVPNRNLSIITSYTPKEMHTGNMAVRLPITAGDASALLSGAANAVSSGVVGSAIGGAANAGRYAINEAYDIGKTFAANVGDAGSQLQQKVAPNYNVTDYKELPGVNGLPVFSAGGQQKGNFCGNTMYMGGNSSWWYDVILYESQPARIFGPHGDIQGYPFASQGVLSLNDLVNNYGFLAGDYVQFRNVLPLMSTGMTTAECDEIAATLKGGCYL